MEMATAADSGDCVPNGTDTNSDNLQQAFLEWRITRQRKPQQRERKVQSEPTWSDAMLARLTPMDPTQKQALREMFLELARGYIGVPYAKRYHQPSNCCCEGCTESGRQLGREPLFLDCCGLVRRVVRQMQRQLGFRLGPGNQAYQFDTLPLRVQGMAQLEPGDLIFYSGTCFDPEANRQHFDMAHVEIFTGGGSGQATIGSRERYKWVMEYDSFLFTSQRWSLISHHFCKLDTWLEGVCRPQHPELWEHFAAAPAPAPAAVQRLAAVPGPAGPRAISSHALSQLEAQDDGQQAEV